MARKSNDVNKIFDKMLMINICTDVLLLLFGIFLLTKPDVSYKIMGAITGLFLLVWAGSMIYSYITRDGAKLYSLNLIFGSLIGLLGLVLIVFPYSLIEFVSNCIGLYLLINGASKINYGLWLRKGKEETWLITITTGGLLIFLSLLIIFFFDNFLVLAIPQVIGMFIIMSTALNIMETVLLKKRSKEIVKIFW
ncbi:MAG: DUF308 domain-containing protein [bacterium]